MKIKMVRKVQVARYEKDFGETFAKNGIDRDRWPDLIRQFKRIRQAQS